MDGVEAGWRGERRDRLLEAAGRIFARTGYERASMDEIAAEAGVGKPTLYRYFDGKAALFAAVFVDALDGLEARLEAVLAEESGIEARLRGVVAELIPTFRDHLVSLRVLSEDAAAIDQSKRRIFRERRVRIAGFLSRALDGAPEEVDPVRVAHLIVGMIWSGTAAIRAGDDEIAAEITALVLNGIAGRGEGAAKACARAPSLRDGGRAGKGRPQAAEAR